VRVYLDTAPVIYAVEQVQGFGAVDERLGQAGTVLIASDLTRMECRVKPLREDNSEVLKNYDDFFEGAVAEIITLSRQVIDRATEIRAQHGFRTPDAIHLAAAVEAKCDVFLTNDFRLDRYNEIAVEIVQAS